MTSAYSMPYPLDPWSSLQHNPHVASKASIDYLSLNPKEYIRNNPPPSHSALGPASADESQIPAAHPMAFAAGRPHVHRPKNVQTDRYEDAEASTKEGNIVVNLMAVKTIQHYNHKDDSGPRAYVYQEPVKVRVALKKRKRRPNSVDVDEASLSGNDLSDDHRDSRRRSSPRPEEHIERWEDARRKTSNSAFRATTRRDVSDRERHRSPPTPIRTSHTQSPIMIIEENPPPPIYSPPLSHHHNHHHPTLVFRTHTADTFAHRPLPSNFHALADPVAPRSPPIPTDYSRGSLYSHNPTLGHSATHESPSTPTNPHHPSTPPFRSFQASHPRPTSATSDTSSPRQSSASPRNFSLSPSPDTPSPRPHSHKTAKPSPSSVNGAAAGGQQTLFTVFSQLPTKTDRNRKATSLADISKRFWVYKCTRCRRMKQKCDVGSPKCWRCERAGVDCMYPEERPPGWSVGKVKGQGTSEEEEEEEEEDEEADEEGEGSRAESDGSARDGYVYERNRSIEETSGEEGGQVRNNGGFVARSTSPVVHVDTGIFTYQQKAVAPSKQDKEKAKERRSDQSSAERKENVIAAPFDGLREEERSSRGREGERVFRFTAWRGASPVRRGGKGKRKREDGGDEEGRFGERLMKLENGRIGREPEVNAMVVAPQPERWDDERRSRNHDSWVDVKVEARAEENSTVSDNLRSEKRRRDRQMVLRRPWEEGFESLEEEDNDDEPKTRSDEYHTGPHSHIHPDDQSRAHPTEPAYNLWSHHDPQPYHDEPLPSINDSHSGVQRALHTPAPYRALERLAEQMVSDTTPYTPSPFQLTNPAYLPRPATPPSATHRTSFDARTDNLWTLASSAVTRNLPSPTPSSSSPPLTPVFPPEHARLPAPTATKPFGPIILPPPSTLLSSAAFMPGILGNASSEKRRMENIMELSVQQMQPRESDMRNSVGAGGYRTRAWEMD